MFRYDRYGLRKRSVMDVMALCFLNVIQVQEESLLRDKRFFTTLRYERYGVMFSICHSGSGGIFTSGQKILHCTALWML